MDENTKQEIKKTRTILLSLAERIRKGDYPHDRREWGGADVVITANESKPSADGFYPEPRYVVTRFAHEVSWFYEEMREAFASLLDGCNKIEFYGRLANMANRYQRRLKGHPENEVEILQALLHEAFAMLEEMEEGNYECLSIAVGGTILDDLIDCAESEGYLGPEETKQFLKSMDERYHDA